MMSQGLTEHHEEIVEYFERRRVSVIFLFRRNLLRRMVSVLANAYDKDARLLNGTHKSHVHSTEEVSLLLFPYFLSFKFVLISKLNVVLLVVQAKILATYRPRLNATLLIPELKLTGETAAKAIAHFKNTRHIVLYYEDLLNNRTVRVAS